MYNTKYLGLKPSPAIRLKIEVQTDRQTESISECTSYQRPFKWYMTHLYQSWKLVGNKENNVAPPLHKGGGIIIAM